MPKNKTASTTNERSQSTCRCGGTKLERRIATGHGYDIVQYRVWVCGSCRSWETGFFPCEFQHERVTAPKKTGRRGLALNR